MSSGLQADGSRTILWCVPRTISTAFAKCLSFIDESEVWFEPYTYSFAAEVEIRKHLNVALPVDYEGNEEIFEKAKELLDISTKSKTEADRLAYGSVKRRLETSTAKHVFVKDMAFAFDNDHYKHLPRGYRHTFLIRNPIRSFNSYRNAMFKQLYEVGFLEGEAADVKTFDMERHDKFFTKGCHVQELYDLWKFLKDGNIDPNPIVIDADDLLTKPAEMLSAYCAAVGLPFDDSLLQWDASTDAFKKMKAAGDDILMGMVTFYGTAMRSSCFFPPSEFPTRDKLAPDVIRCSDKVKKYFDEMYESRLQV